MTVEEINYLVSDVRQAYRICPIDPRRCRESLARVEEVLLSALRVRGRVERANVENPTHALEEVR